MEAMGSYKMNDGDEEREKLESADFGAAKCESLLVLAV